MAQFPADVNSPPAPPILQALTAAGLQVEQYFTERKSSPESPAHNPAKGQNQIPDISLRKGGYIAEISCYPCDSQPKGPKRFIDFPRESQDINTVFCLSCTFFSSEPGRKKILLSMWFPISLSTSLQVPLNASFLIQRGEPQAQPVEEFPEGRPERWCALLYQVQHI